VPYSFNSGVVTHCEDGVRILSTVFKNGLFSVSVTRSEAGAVVERFPLSFFDTPFEAAVEHSAVASRYGIHLSVDVLCGELRLTRPYSRA
jgi:hypothetical protein